MNLSTNNEPGGLWPNLEHFDRIGESRNMQFMKQIQNMIKLNSIL